MTPLGNSEIKSFGFLRIDLQEDIVVRKLLETAQLYGEDELYEWGTAADLRCKGSCWAAVSVAQPMSLVDRLLAVGWMACLLSGGWSQSWWAAVHPAAFGLRASLPLAIGAGWGWAGCQRFTAVVEWLPVVLASLGMTLQGLGSPFLFPHGHWHGQKWECAYLWPKLGELGGQIAAHHLLLNAGIQACSTEEGITMLLIQSRGLHLIFLQLLVCWMILSGALLPMKQLCFFITV